MAAPHLRKHRSRSAVLAALAIWSSVNAGACRGASERSYQLEGQIVAVDQARQELTVKHGDIRGFMPAMTMAYKVRGSELEGRTAGELIRATLVVEGSSGYLRSIEHTGIAPLPAATPPTRV